MCWRERGKIPKSEAFRNKRLSGNSGGKKGKRPPWGKSLSYGSSKKRLRTRGGGLFQKKANSGSPRSGSDGFHSEMGGGGKEALT